MAKLSQADRKDDFSEKKQQDGRTAVAVKNRKTLLMAAQSLFRERPYEEVTIRDIVNRGELGIGTFYNHFADKESIFRELLELKKKKSIPIQHKRRESADSFFKLIHEHFKIFFEQVAHDPSYFELFKRNADFIRRIVDSPAHIQGLESLRNDLDMAVKRKLIAPVDTEMLAAAIMGIAIEMGAIMVNRAQLEPERTADFAARLVLGEVAWTP
jgi:AcrR family transcriptional regulator